MNIKIFAFLTLFAASLTLHASNAGANYPSTYGIELGMPVTQAKSTATSLGVPFQYIMLREVPGFDQPSFLLIDARKQLPKGNGSYINQTLQVLFYPSDPQASEVAEDKWNIGMLVATNQSMTLANIESVLNHYIRLYGPIRTALGSPGTYKFLFHPQGGVGQELSIPEALKGGEFPYPQAPEKRCSEGITILKSLLRETSGRGSPEKLRSTYIARYGRSVLDDWARCQLTISLEASVKTYGPDKDKTGGFVVTIADLGLINELLDHGGKKYRMAVGNEPVPPIPSQPYKSMPKPSDCVVSQIDGNPPAAEKAIIQQLATKFRVSGQCISGVSYLAQENKYRFVIPKLKPLDISLEEARNLLKF